MSIRNYSVLSAGISSSLLVGVHLLAEKRVMGPLHNLKEEKKVNPIPVIILNGCWHAATAILLTSGIVFTCNGLGLDKFTLFGRNVISTSSDSVDVMSKLNLGLSLGLIYVDYLSSDGKEGFLKNLSQMPQWAAFLGMYLLSRQ